MVTHMEDGPMPMTSPKLLPKLTEVRCAEAPPAGGVTRDSPDSAAVSVTEQVAFALGNIERIASVVGAGRDDVVKCTVFVTGIEHWDEANRAYATFFGAHRPARSVVPCAELHFCAKVEIEAVVAVGA